MSVVFNVSGIQYSYESVKALDGVNLTIHEGDFVGIIGPNGSGKSTFLKNLAALLKPDRGAIYLSGQKLFSIGRKELAKKVALVPQEIFLEAGFSVEDIVMMGRYPYLKKFQPPADDDLRVCEEALRVTGITHLRKRTVNELSGGERQRVIIARALAQQAKILMLDEPTAYLDINHQLEIFTLLQALNERLKITVICVLHDINLAAQFCKEICLFEKGRVFAFGKVEDVINGENISHVYKTKVQIGFHPQTHKPQVILLSKTEINEKAFKDRTVHLICGGGRGGEIMDLLVNAGYTVTAGVLNKWDSDWEKALNLGIEVIEEKPFSHISEEKHYQNLASMGKADCIVLTDIPVGFGNILNLEGVYSMLQKGKPVIIIDDGRGDKDFTNGQASNIKDKIKAAGGRWVRSIFEAVDVLDDTIQKRGVSENA
jgi:iron complex transport system ATP-binding protein